jgi:hypothetical protein
MDKNRKKVKKDEQKFKTNEDNGNENVTRRREERRKQEKTHRNFSRFFTVRK